MSISSLYDKTVITKRLAAVVGTNKETWGTNLTQLQMTIHPVETQQQNLNDGGFYNTLKAWCDVNADVLIGDRVIDGSVTYTVRGVSRYDFGRNSHLRLTLARGK